MNKLVEGVLTIGTGLTPDNWSSLIVDGAPLQINMLTITLHIKLLQVCAQTIEVLVIGQNCHSFSTEEIVVPDTNQSKNDWQITLEWSCAEMFIHLMKTGQHLAEALRPESNHEREANGRVE